MVEKPHKIVDGIKIYLTDEEIAAIEIESIEWEAGAARRLALLEIARLEALETPRRLAEAVLTQEGKIWLTNNRDLINQQRSKL